MSDERELADRVRSAIARVPVVERPLDTQRRRSLSSFAAVAGALVVLVAALGAGRWLADYRAGSAAGGACGSLDAGVVPNAPPPLRTIRLDQRWTIDGLGTRCIAGIRVYDGFFDIVSYQDGTPSYAEPWTSASVGLSLGLLSDERGRTFAGAHSSGFTTSSGQTVRVDEYEAFPNPSQQTRGDLLAGVHELRLKVQQVLQAVHGPWRFDGIAAKNGTLSVAATAAGHELHLYDLVLRSDGFSVAYLPLGEVKTGSVVATDLLIAQDDRGTTYKFAGNERVGSSANLYAKFSPAPPAGALLHIEIPTVYVASDQTWTGTLTLPAAAAPSARGTTAPSPAPTASPVTAPQLRWSQPVALSGHDAIYGVVKWHDRYVAVGQSSDGTAYVGAAFTSPDGQHWQRTSTFVANPNLAVTPTRLLLVVNRGTTPRSTEVWASTDGTTWQRDTRLDLPAAAITKIVTHDSTLLGLGTDETDTVRLFRSVDGAAWAPLSAPAPKAIVRSIEALTDGFLAIGRDGDPDISSGGVGAYGTGVPAAWWSADGRTWSAAHVDGTSAAGAQVNEVFAVDHGYLAVGSDSSSSPRAAVLWSSPDGHDWKLLGAPAHWGIASSDGEQLLIFGYADAQTGLLGPWYTGDGTTWTQPTMTGDQVDIPAFIGTANHNSRVDNIHAFPDGVVVIGQQNGQMTAWFATKE